jgi:hypothetical protein
MRNAIAVMLLLAAGCAHTPRTLTGWVSDASCTIEHVGGKGADCVRKCVKGGAHIGHPEWAAQAMVLVLDGTNQVVVVDNPESLTGREAQHVAVTGEVKANHVRVRDVKPVA